MSNRTDIVPGTEQLHYSLAPSRLESCLTTSSLNNIGERTPCESATICYAGISQASHVSILDWLPTNNNHTGRGLTFVSLCSKIADDTWLTSPSRYRGGHFFMGRNGKAAKLGSRP